MEELVQMSIRNEVSKFSEIDLWSMMLFVLFKVKDIPEYSSLSELCYILDKKNFLKLCQYFGGTTITIPRIEDMEELLYGMLLYQYVDVEKIDYEKAITLIDKENVQKSVIVDSYRKIKKVLDQYEFTPRSKC